MVEPGTLVIKGHKLDILFHFTHWFTLQTSDDDIIIGFRADSTSSTMLQLHVDWKKILAVRYATFFRATCNNAVKD